MAKSVSIHFEITSLLPYLALYKSCYCPMQTCASDRPSIFIPCFPPKEAMERVGDHIRHHLHLYFGVCILKMFSKETLYEEA